MSIVRHMRASSYLKFYKGVSITQPSFIDFFYYLLYLCMIMLITLKNCDLTRHSPQKSWKLQWLFEEPTPIQPWLAPRLGELETLAC